MAGLIVLAGLLAAVELFFAYFRGGGVPVGYLPDTQPTASATRPPAPTLPAPADPALPALWAEPRQAELEWPAIVRLGDAASVRLSLVPSAEGYTLTVEDANNQALTQALSVRRPPGYEVWAELTLDGVGWEIAPGRPQLIPLPENEPVTARWSVKPRAPGQHWLTVEVRLRWIPRFVTDEPVRQSQAWSRSVPVNVVAWLGLDTANLWLLGMGGLLLGLSLNVAGRWPWRRNRRNRRLQVAAPAGVTLTAPETHLLQSVFADYARALIATEFRSGYSGARTLLTVPVRADGRADAPAILKLGPRADILREHHNYLTFVQHTLPPITARLEGAPAEHGALAAVRYTFIGQAGRTPTSLRAALHATPDPRWLHRLFDTFGPQWW